MDSHTAVHAGSEAVSNAPDSGTHTVRSDSTTLPQSEQPPRWKAERTAMVCNTKANLQVTLSPIQERSRPLIDGLQRNVR